MHSIILVRTPETIKPYYCQIQNRSQHGSHVQKLADTPCIPLVSQAEERVTWETLTREIRNFNYFRANFACHVPETGGFIELEQSVGWVGDGTSRIRIAII